MQRDYPGDCKKLFSSPFKNMTVRKSSEEEAAIHIISENRSLHVEEVKNSFEQVCMIQIYKTMAFHSQSNSEQSALKNIRIGSKCIFLLFELPHGFMLFHQSMSPHIDIVHLVLSVCYA